MLETLLNWSSNSAWVHKPSLSELNENCSPLCEEWGGSFDIYKKVNISPNTATVGKYLYVTLLVGT